VIATDVGERSAAFEFGIKRSEPSGERIIQ
jgi:hypothetical protein